MGVLCFHRWLGCLSCDGRIRCMPSLQAALDASLREMDEAPIADGVSKLLYEYRLKLMCADGASRLRWLDTRLISRAPRPPTQLRPRAHTSLLLSAMVGGSVSDDLADALNARLHSFDRTPSTSSFEALRVDEVMAAMAGRIARSASDVLLCTDEHLHECRLLPTDSLLWGKTV